MKKSLPTALFSVLFITASAFAQAPMKVPELNEAPDSSPAAFGTLAGAAYACKAGKKLDDFELIVSRILANTAPSEAMETAFLQEYAQAKRDAIRRQEKNPPMPCSQFIKEFSAQKIFQSTVMSDGSVKTPNGTWLLPRGQKEPPKNQ